MMRYACLCLLMSVTLLASSALAVDEAKAQSSEAHSFTILAIGDTGEANLDLFRNALGINKATNDRDHKDRSALLFLGDNFYKHGLADESASARERLFHDIYGRWFESSFAALRNGKATGTTDPSAEPSGPAGAPGTQGVYPRVHAIAGNHDYYSKEASKEILSALPLGFTTLGNEYEESRPEWVYHHQYPSDAYWELKGENDSAPQAGRKAVQAIFVDSTLLVRSTWTTTCRDSARARPDKGKEIEWLSCAQRLRQRDDLIALLTKYPRDSVWRVLVTHHPLHTVGSHGGARWAAPGEVVGDEREPCSLPQRPLGHFANSFDPEDLCTEGSEKYRELVLDTIQKTGVPVQAVLSGHDHSLQLLTLDRVCAGRQPCPAVQIVSGAGAKTTVVKKSNLPHYVTAMRSGEKARGKSKAGWVALRFSAEEIEVRFYSGEQDITKEMAAESSIVLDADGRPRSWQPDQAQ